MFHVVKRKGDEVSFVLRCPHPPLYRSLFITCPGSGNLNPDAPSVAPAPGVLPVRAISWIWPHVQRLLVPPPHWTVPLEYFFKRLHHIILLFSAGPFHCSPASFFNQLSQQRELHFLLPQCSSPSRPSSCNNSVPFRPLSSSSWVIFVESSFPIPWRCPSLPSVHLHFSHPKQKTVYTRSHILSHLFFERMRLSTRLCWRSASFPPDWSVIFHHDWTSAPRAWSRLQTETCVTTRRFDDHVHHLICIFYLVWHNPIMVCPHKAANLVAAFEAILDVTAHLSVFPMLLHIPELFSGYLEPEPWGLHASLFDAFRESCSPHFGRWPRPQDRPLSVLSKITISAVISLTCKLSTLLSPSATGITDIWEFGTSFLDFFEHARHPDDWLPQLPELVWHASWAQCW